MSSFDEFPIEQTADLKSDPEQRETAPSASAHDRPPSRASTHTDLDGSAPLVEGPGTRIGPYTLVKMVGEGGFGSVFLAEQQTPVRRKVALKIIKLGMDTRQVVARFEQERQVLARMDHPNIARVFDAGSTVTGRPYFVMEFVKGEPIVQYCDRKKLSIPNRLWLFAQVCVAVQHAHTKGIIHRDIKPGNILASTQDGRPHSKVIDFGVAKATNARDADMVMLTEARQLVGTPMYMSPEQAAGSSDIDARTDIYSLGVLLYELLTGSTPFDFKTLSAGGYAAMQKIICETEPSKPSTRVAPNAPLIDAIADRRHIEPRRLNALVRGELDWIVMRAMEKDRARRYETASALAADVRRYLAGEEVLAAPPSASYRVAKLARRHRGLVAAAALVGLAVLLGLAATAWEAYRANTQREMAVQAQMDEALHREQAERAQKSEQLQRAAADVERAGAERIAGFMEDVLKGAGPSVARGRDITMLREMLDGAAGRIDSGLLRDSPATELRLRRTIGTTYRELALFPDAARMLGPIPDLARSLHDGDHEEVASALHEVGLLLHARGDLAGAESPLRESLEISRRLHPDDHPQVADGLDCLAMVLQSRSDLTNSQPLFREALEMNQRLHPGDHAAVARSLGHMSEWNRLHRDLAEADGLARSSLAMYRNLYQGDHPDVADSLHSMALIMRLRRDSSRAEAVFRESLAMYQRLFPGDHPMTARGLNSLAAFLQMRGDLADAGPYLRESVEMYDRLFPDDHPQAAAAMENLIAHLAKSGDLEGALSTARESVAMYEHTQGADAGVTGGARLRLGNVLVQLGRHSEAETELLAAERRLDDAEGIPPVRYKNCLASLVHFYSVWNGAEPGKGHDVQAADWKSKLTARFGENKQRKQEAAPKDTPVGEPEARPRRQRQSRPV